MNDIATTESNIPVAVDQDSPDINMEDDDQHKYLTFNVSTGIYGVGIAGVKEIIEYPAVTRVPMTPPFIRGVINLRGNVVPVIDLAVRLDKNRQEISKRTCVIIVELQAEGEDADVGFVVDSVAEVIDIPDEKIELAPAFGAEVRTDFISGMGKLSKDFIVLLDLDKVLSIEELAELSQSFAA
jgi:purine-binding chemotaxis protein CheW